LIHLNEDEKNILWEALVNIKSIYTGKNRKEEEKITWDLLIMITLADKITIDFCKDGSTTEEGAKIIREIIDSRKAEKPRVIPFPTFQ